MASDPVQLLARWRQGDQQAATELFQLYANRLMALARAWLPARVAHRVDPEDVVQSVYRGLFAETRAGRYELQRGGDLWRLLVTCTIHKLDHQVRRLRSQKRAVERERNFGSEDSLLGLQSEMLARGPAPEEGMAFVELLEQIMRGLEPPHRRMLEMRLQGYNVAEIAAATQRTQRTVRRVLEQVKQQLEQRQS